MKAFVKQLGKKSCLAVLIVVNLTACRSGPWEADMIRYNNLQRDMKRLYDIPPPPPQMDLTDIIDMALERNLSTRIKLYEYAVQHELATGEALKMLPSLIVNGDVSWRNRNTGSSSESLVPGIPPAPPSISSEQNVHRYDITAIFNLLDFGLSFLRSRQESNKARTMNLEYARLQQNLIVDVSKQYWRAVAAKRALEGSKNIQRTLNRQIFIIEKLIDRRIISELNGLRNENQLINLKIIFQHYEKEFHEAMTSLKQFMGLPSSFDFEIVYAETAPIDIGCYNICELEEIALFNRPELKIGDLEEKIARDDIYAAILQMLPNGEGFLGDFFDGNRFLIFNHWLIMGARATWNLLAFPRRWYEKCAGEYRVELARQNRLNLSIGVITQVNLAYLDYLDNLEQYQLSDQLRRVNERLLKAAKNEVRFGSIHPADLVKFEADALLAEVDALKSYGELQYSLEQLNNALGLPFFFNKENEEIEEMVEICTPVNFKTKEVKREPLPKVEAFSQPELLKEPFIESKWETEPILPAREQFKAPGDSYFKNPLPRTTNEMLYEAEQMLYETPTRIMRDHLKADYSTMGGSHFYFFSGDRASDPINDTERLNRQMEEAMQRSVERSLYNYNEEATANETSDIAYEQLSVDELTGDNEEIFLVAYESMLMDLYYSLLEPKDETDDYVDLIVDTMLLNRLTDTDEGLDKYKAYEIFLRFEIERTEDEQ